MRQSHTKDYRNLKFFYAKHNFFYICVNQCYSRVPDNIYLIVQVLKNAFNSVIYKTNAFDICGAFDNPKLISTSSALKLQPSNFFPSSLPLYFYRFQPSTLSIYINQTIVSDWIIKSTTYIHFSLSIVLISLSIHLIQHFISDGLCQIKVDTFSF